jgi:hypothetical protein
MSWQDSLENFGWSIRNLFGGGETVIGPNETLPPDDVSIRDLRDYSGTATFNEIACNLHSPGTQFHNRKILKNYEQSASTPTLNLGRFLKIAGGKARVNEEIWLQENSIYRNLAIIGPKGSGKTEGFIIPGIKTAIDAGLSNIVLDVKGGAMIDELGSYALEKGVQVFYWSCRPEEVGRSHSINLLDNIQTIQDAKILAKALYGTVEDMGQNRQYAERDITWIANWMMLVKEVFGETAALKHIYQIAESPITKLNELLPQCRDPRLYSAIASQIQLIQNSDSTNSAFTWGIQEALDFFSWTNFEQLTGHSDVVLRDINTRQTLLIIGAEMAGRDVTKKISSAFIDILMTIFYERFTANVSAPGLIFWIDEFPRIQREIDLSSFTSVSRSARGGVVITAQNLEQIDPSYREEVMQNFETIILCRGSGPGAAEWLNRLAGSSRSQNSRRRRHFDPNPQDDFPWARTRSERERYEVRREDVPILDPREIQYPIGEKYVATIHSISASRKPFLVDYTREINHSNTRWLPPRRQQSLISWGRSPHQLEGSRIRWGQRNTIDTSSSSTIDNTDTARIRWHNNRPEE